MSLRRGHSTKGLSERRAGGTRNPHRLASGRRALCAALVLLATSLTACDANGPVDIRVDVATRHQVMQGWEALIGGMPECNHTAWNGARDRVLDLAAFDLGLNRVRLPLRSGYEHHTDPFPGYMRGEMTFDNWKAGWFRPQNDNDDPRVAAPDGFQWSFLDQLVETEVLPLKRRLQSRGDDLWVNLEFIGGRNVFHQDDPQEYAELVVVTFEHLRDRFGLVPNSLEVINEPNLHSKWTPREVAAAMLAARARLAERGFRPQFIAPSTSTMEAAKLYLDTMLTVPGVRETLTDVAYHRYSGGPTALRRLADQAKSLGYRTAMLEKIGADVHTLYEDLTVGNVSAWQQFGMVHCAKRGWNDGGGIYIRLDQVDTLQPYGELAKRSRYLRQYFRYVRLGAQRVEAESDEERVEATAFVSRDGQRIVVVNDSTGRELRIAGLPAGRYGATHTTAQDDTLHHADTTIADGGTIHLRLPAPGVLTVFSK